MSIKLKYIAISTMALLPAMGSLAAQEHPGAGIVREISRYVSPQNRAAQPAQFTYMPDGLSYAMLSDDGKRVEIFDIRSGEKKDVLVDLGHVREVQMPDMEGFIISPNASKVILYRDVQKIYRRSFTAEYYVYDVRSRILDRLSPTFTRASIPTFSPDSRVIAFVADNDIYLKKLDYNNQVRVTEDGAAGKIINGATDWTYEEEFSITNTFAWAPDNLTLCYLKFDEARVPLYTLPLYEGTCDPHKEYAQYPGLLSYKYPVAGQVNSIVSLHSYDIETRKIKDIPLPDKNIEYIPRIDYGPTPEQLMVSTLNRDQNRYDIYSVNPKSTVAKAIITEKSDAWIAPENYESISFDKDGIVMLSSRTGFTHLYKYNYAGVLTRTLTQGNFDVTAYYGADAAGNFYYQAAKNSPMDRGVYRIDRKNITTAITSETGTNGASFSPNRDFAVFSYSDTKTPPRYTLSTAAGKSLRVLEDNAALASRYDGLMPPKEFIKVPSDGLELNAWIIRPFDFDPTKKYPLVMVQYSGPGSQSVLNRWEMDWMYYFANKGFVVACVDGRGTGGRGNAFMHPVYKNLGHYETIDQINAAKYLATLPGIDGSRMGIHGWSYGGYETLMCVTDRDNPFAAAVSVAPVTDWRYYDTVYAERYMLTPQQNESGYNVSAPLSRAAQMSGNVLIMYGTADDNVHPANSLQFVSALQSAGLLCDMLVFPNMNHSIYGCNARAVVYANMFRYFRNNLQSK